MDPVPTETCLKSVPVSFRQPDPEDNLRVALHLSFKTKVAVSLSHVSENLIFFDVDGLPPRIFGWRQHLLWCPSFFLRLTLSQLYEKNAFFLDGFI